MGIGMALGIAIGELPILTPSGEYFSIGSAAGTLIVGLIFGRIGRIGPIATALPFTTCQVMAELGLLIFLAQAGAKAGGQILEAFTSGDWIRIFALGVIMTSIMAIGLYCTMRWVNVRAYSLWSDRTCPVEDLRGMSVTKFALLAQKRGIWAVLPVQGEFCPGLGVGTLSRESFVPG